MIQVYFKKFFSKTAPAPKRYWSWLQGHFAEYRALLYLVLRGYHLISRRFKCPLGEIDLIVRQGTQILFVEVKFRQTLKSAAESLSWHQRQRLVRAGKYFLMKHPSLKDEIRFDVILINRYYQLEHHQNAFEEEFPRV